MNGHIHGQRFTATRPGFYTVGFRFVDASTNGAAGGPIHTPSDVFEVYFQGGVSIASLDQTGGVTTVTVGTVFGRSFQLEYNIDLANVTGWMPIGFPASGTDHLLSLRDTNAVDSRRFYRVAISP